MFKLTLRASRVCARLVLPIVLALSVHIGQPLAARPPAETPEVAVGPQYGSTHVYVKAADFARLDGSDKRTLLYAQGNLAGIAYADMLAR